MPPSSAHSPPPASTPTGGNASPPPPKLHTQVVRRKLRELELLPTDENARFMEGAEYKLLVENLRMDGVLTSSPLVYGKKVLSGNHRVEAAIEAGIEEADVIEVLGDLPDERALALQLSHNAISGKDDPGRLARLYSKLDLSWKRFSGLTDGVLLAVQELDIKALAIGQPAYQELLILFLPEEQDRFLKCLAKVESVAKKSGIALAARFEDFGSFFDTVVAAKRVRGIHNSAVALRTIADIALRVLEAEEVEKAAVEAATPPDPEKAKKAVKPHGPPPAPAPAAPTHGQA